MIRVKSESDWEMPDMDQIDSPSHDDNSARASPRRRAGTQLKKGPWTKSEDAILEAYVKKHGVRNWNVVQKDTGLQRCGKSCRLRWTNHLRPDLKKGTFTKEELNLIIKLHSDMGNKWAQIAAYLPGRTDNEIKNYWNTRIKKCQRTNTPIYPANIRLQASNGDQLESADFNFREKLANDLVQANGLYVPNFTWGNHIDDGDILSYAPQLPDFSMSDLLASNLGSENYGFMNQVNQAEVLRESGIPFHVVNTTMNGMFSSIDQSFDKSKMLVLGFACHCATNFNIKCLLHFAGKFDGSHAFSNGTYSASRSTNGPSKMELPSFQFAESDLNSWSTCARTCAMPHANFADLSMHPSAEILPVEFDSLCMALSNTGPLEELLPKSHALSPVGNQQLSVGSSSPSVGTPCGTMMESPELDLFERDTDFCTLINGCLSAPPLCPSSPDEFPCSDFSSAPSFVFRSNEPAVPQYDQGYFPHSELSETDAFPNGP